MTARGVRLFLWAWSGLVVAYFAVGIFTPWWIRCAVLPTAGPVSLLVSYRLLFGRRTARRQWLILRFVLAYCLAPSVIVARGTRMRGRRRLV